jgi:hypothetical protein
LPFNSAKAVFGELSENRQVSFINCAIEQNKISDFSQKIAEFLNLSKANDFNGHSFRSSTTTPLAEKARIY